jgi:hypothetical protein
VFSPPPGTGRKKMPPEGRVFRPSLVDCELCHGGDARKACTCILQDRCSDTNDSGHQCILGAGHSLRHVTAAGKYWT